MAARTLTVSANFDSASTAGWNSGDTLTVSQAAQLTWDSDSRWGQRGVAGGGVLSTTTYDASTGGTALIDGRNTWWIPFSASTGNVPALGTLGVQNCTGGTSGATGELLGVWTALGVAPTAAGAAMPATGFLKFRSKVGTFVAETVTLPGGATATVTGAGTRGWLHHATVLSTITISRLNSHTIRGDWFYLDNATGVDGQVVQHYVADYCAAIEVETAPASGVFDKWLGCYEGLNSTSLTAISISGAANNGSGLIRITSGAHGRTTGDQVTISGVGGVTAANGTWTATVISTTVIDLVGSAFAGVYTASTGSLIWSGVGATNGAMVINSVVNNGAGLIRVVTSTPHALTGGQIVKIAGVVGTTEANGSWACAVINTTTIDLTASIFVNAYVSGGTLKQSTWNDANINRPSYQITGVANNGSGMMRLTLNAPARLLANKQAPVTAMSNSGGFINFSTNPFEVPTGTFVYFTSSIAGSGACAALAGTLQVVHYVNFQNNIVIGAAFGGTYTASSGSVWPVLPPYSIGTCNRIATITNNGSGLMRITTSRAHSILNGATVAFTSLTGTGNIAALNGTFGTVVYVSDTAFDITGSTFGGTFTDGIVRDIGQCQSIDISGIVGTGAVSALNGTTMAAVMVDPTHIDINVAFGGTYTSGGVTTGHGDQRGRNYLTTADGKITFGGAVTGVGLTPASGCRIRVPNVHWSATPTQSFGVNLSPLIVPNSRTSFTSNQGVIDWEYASLGDVYAQCANNFSTRIVNSHVWDRISIDTNSSPYELTNVAVPSCYDTNTGPISVTNQLAGGTATNCVFGKLVGIGFPAIGSQFLNSAGLVFIGCLWTSSQNNLISCFQASFINGFTMTNCQVTGRPLMAELNAVRITNIGTCDRQFGNLNPIGATTAFSFDSCSDFVVDGAYLGFGVEVPPYGAYISIVDTCSNGRFRNFGTRARPLNLKNHANAFMSNATFCQRTRMARCPFTDTRNGFQASDVAATAASDFVITDSGHVGGYSQEIHRFGWNQQNKRYAGAGVQTFGAAVGQFYNATAQNGCHFTDWELSPTSIGLHIQCTEKTTLVPSSTAYTIDAGTVLFNGTGGVLLKTIGDQLTWTWSYFVLGLTGFQNVAPILSGTNTGNLTLTYDLDKGTGFSGSFQTLNAANLSAEAGVLATGVRIRVRAVCSVTNTGNILNGIAFFGITSAVNIAANLYEQNQLTETFTGLQTGTYGDIFMVGGSSQTRIDYQSTGSSLPMVAPWASDYAGVARLRLCGWQPLEQTMTVNETDQSFPMTPVAWATVPTTNPGALTITVTNHGASPVTWNGKPFSITIQDNSGGYTAQQIVNFIQWNIQLIAQFFGFRGRAWPTMTIPNTTSYETQYGTLYGSAGALLKGVRVVQADGVTPHYGFTQMQADDGTYYAVPQAGTITLTVPVGSSVVVYDQTGARVSYTAASSGTVTASFGPALTGSYTYRVCQYGFLPASGSISVTTGGAKSATVVLATDASISQPTVATVIAYTTLGTLDKLYDYTRYYETTTVGIDFVMETKNGAGIDFGAWVFTVDATAASVFAFTGTALTIKATNLIAGTIFQGFLTSAAVATANGARIDTWYTSVAGRSVLVLAPNIVSGSRFYSFNGGTDLDNAVVGAGGYYFRTIWTTDTAYTYYIAQQSGVTALAPITGLFLLTNTGVTVLDTQVANAIYNANAIDGSLVTSVVWNTLTIEIDVTAAVGWKTIYASYCYEITTAYGIKHYFGDVTAQDVANYVFANSITFIYTGGGSGAIVGGDGYGSRANGTFMGSNGIQIDNGKAYLASGSAVTSAVWDAVSENGKAYGTKFRDMSAVLLGKTTGGGTNTEVFDNDAGSPRITSVNDGTNRTSVTSTGP